VAHGESQREDPKEAESPCWEGSPANARKAEGGISGDDVLLGLITTPPGDAERIANTLVERGLVACCNVLSPVTSIFNWKGARESQSEALLVAKTIRAKSQDLIDVVREIHPYDLPEVIFMPVVLGLEDYLKWVRDECRPGEKTE
jgi:periplasmic divalent cation tolerance protein